MFNKLSLLALLAPLVAGLSVNVPSNPTSGGSVTITWTSAPGDPATFSIELMNEIFHNSFAIGNNLVPELGQVTLMLPVVPVGDGYTLQLVDIGNINNVFATSGTFSIGPNGATSVSSAASSSTSATTTSGRSSSSASPSSTVITPRPTPSTTSSFGFTVTSSAPTSSGANGTSSGTPAASSSSAASVPLKMNTNVGAFAAIVFSAIAGAAIVAL